MSDVYLSENEQGVPVTIKFNKHPVSSDLIFRVMKLRNENILIPDIALRCEQPSGVPPFSIPPCYGVQLIEVTRYIDEDTIPYNGSVPLPQALRVIHNVLNLADYLHKRGIVHRDIRAQNIFWDGLGDEVILFDFNQSSLLNHPEDVRLDLKGIGFLFTQMTHVCNPLFGCKPNQPIPGDLLAAFTGARNDDDGVVRNPARDLQTLSMLVEHYL